MDQEKIAEEDKQRKRKALLIVGISLLVLLLAGGGYYLVRQQRTINDMRELSALDKQMLQDQFDELNMQYEEFRVLTLPRSAVSVASSTPSARSSRATSSRSTRSIGQIKPSALRTKLSARRSVASPLSADSCRRRSRICQRKCSWPLSSPSATSASSGSITEDETPSGSRA